MDSRLDTCLRPPYLLHTVVLLRECRGLRHSQSVLSKALFTRKNTQYDLAVAEQLRLLHAYEHDWLRLRECLKPEHVPWERLLLEYEELQALLYEHLCVGSDLLHWTQRVLAKSKWMQWSPERSLLWQELDLRVQFRLLGSRLRLRTSIHSPRHWRSTQILAIARVHSAVGLPRVVILHCSLEWPCSTAVPLRWLLDTNWDVKRVCFRPHYADIILHSSDNCGQQVWLRPAFAPLRLCHDLINTARSPDTLHDIRLCLMERSHDWRSV